MTSESLWTYLWSMHSSTADLLRKGGKWLYRKKILSKKISWAYISDLELLVFDMRHLSKEVRERFHSDLRIVVDYLAGEDISALDQKIIHKREFVKMLSVLSAEADVAKIEDTLDAIEKKQRNSGNEKEDENMAGLFTQYLDMGKAEATLNTINNLIQNLHFTLEEACEAAGITVRNYEEAKELLNGQNT